jgi:hypothetical protein
MEDNWMGVVVGWKKAALTQLLQALSRDLLSAAYLHQYGAANTLRPTLETQCAHIFVLRSEGNRPNGRPNLMGR